MNSPLPLTGIRVIDLSNAGPGPRCSRVLADLGARITRIAPPRAREIEMPFYAYSAGRGWVRLGLDLKSERGRELLLQLVQSADVFMEGFRPGVAARLRIAHEDLIQIKPDLIYCSLSGYGQAGPAANRVGHDINYAASAGLFAAGERGSDGSPALPGLTVADAAGGGLQAVIAILAALLRRQNTGTGAFLDVSATDGMLHLMSLYVDEYLATGVEPAPGSSVLSGRFACYDFYCARDGRWISVGAIEAGFFAKLCTALGCEQWIKHQYHEPCQGEIRAAFQTAFATRDRDDWLQHLDGLDACVAPVNSIAEVTADPTFIARGLFPQTQHPDHGRFRQVANIFGRMFEAAQLPPQETDADKILAELGVDEVGIQELRRAGIVS